MKKNRKKLSIVLGCICGYAMKTPGAPHLWEINDNSERLDTERAKIFHSVAAKLLYVTNRKRPDIEQKVAYFTTRVANNNVDDWKKMKCCIKFIKQSREDKRIIGCFNLKELFTWVDTLFAVDLNMRSHTGGTISMGYGMINFHSSKQMLNTKSTTESEIVGISEYVPFNICIVIFYEAQGYKITKNILFQENESAIKMERNRQESCTGSSIHINILHFFVKYRVDK